MAHRFRRVQNPDAGSVTGPPALDWSDQRTALLRRRRNTELAGVGGGGLGALTSLAVALVRDHLPPDVAPTVATCLYLDLPLSLFYIAVSVVCLYAVTSRWYPMLSVIHIGLGCTGVVVAIFGMPEPARGAAASLVVLPVLSASARFGPRAALVTWAVAFLGYGTAALALHMESTPDGAGTLTVGLALQGSLMLLVAWFTGNQAQAVNRHLSALEAAGRIVAHQATHDALTGLANRSALDSRVADLSGTGALLVIDLDSFKAVNDTHGHAAGDRVLQAVADRLRAGARQDDLVVRTGGDEFLVVLHGADRETAESVATSLRTALTEPVPIAGGSLRVSASIGVATTVQDGPWDFDALAAEADLRMYETKAARHDGRRPTGAASGALAHR